MEKLSKKCFVKEVLTYESVIDYSKKDQLLDIMENENVDYITFASSSTVKNFMTLIGEGNINKLKLIKIISIGDITSKTIKEFDLDVYKQSDEATIASMIDAISNDKFNLNTGVLTC